ncbi:DUF3592 domain-containing protein [Streptomyces sp. NBC_00083]|uniref:DUF3592 domain-containing protein n=1 Tax=Streptomyces sp. NBC_00083 TaxID=2975647 RepID=UPI00225214F3|nr:DUF3592 domain-containing protein [Streptomyces sp. NBC_00083]MCX5387325.1 DUF3592 domain-containing protein [Streptomyces sp. NBC_00083]
MDRAWLFSLIPLCIGAGFLCAGVHGLRRLGALRRDGRTAVGRVVRHDTRRGDEGAAYHHPVVAWTTHDGRACTYPSAFGRSTILRGFGVGHSVTVLYDERNPRRFVIHGWDSKAFYVLFTVMGAVLTTGTTAVVVAVLVGV